MTPTRKVERLLAQGNVRRLCRLLRRGDPLVRRRAAQALGELGHPEAVPCLAQALRRDADQYVQRWVIEALRKIGSPDAIDALVEAVFSRRVQVSRLAELALSVIPARQAVEVLKLKEALTRNDWEALGAIGPEAQRALAIILRSEQYAGWPSAKSQRVLRIAVEIGVTLPSRFRHELAEMGLYVSGVHTLGDLLRGLHHRNPQVKIAAAERLARTGRSRRWLLWLLYRSFRRETQASGDRRVAAAYGRALDQLDDPRAVEFCKERLYAAGGQPAAEAAYLLAEMGTASAIEALFWFAAEPPPPPSYRNVPLAMSALESAGPAAVQALRPLLQHESSNVRRLMIEVVARSAHPDRLSLLEELCRDKDPDVQRAALDALADADTAEAAERLYSLAGEAPQEWLVRALASMTHPAGPEYLRKLAPQVTTLSGILRDDARPVTNARVLVVQERFDEQGDRWEWQPASVRVHTDSAGAFALAVPGWTGEGRLRLKVVIPVPGSRMEQDTFLANLPLQAGLANRVEARIDRMFDCLVLTVRPE